MLPLEEGQPKRRQRHCWRHITDQTDRHRTSDSRPTIRHRQTDSYHLHSVAFLSSAKSRSTGKSCVVVGGTEDEENFIKTTHSSTASLSFTGKYTRVRNWIIHCWNKEEQILGQELLHRGWRDGEGEEDEQSYKLWQWWQPTKSSWPTFLLASHKSRPDRLNGKCFHRVFFFSWCDVSDCGGVLVSRIGSGI